MSKFWLVLIAFCVAVRVPAQELVKDVNSTIASQVTVYDVYDDVCYACGNFIFFMGIDKEYGRELWRTDGTAAGTIRLTDVRFGPDDGFYSQPIQCMNGTAIFRAEGLWKSDGTVQGTERLVNNFWVTQPAVFSDKILYEMLGGVYLFNPAQDNSTLIKQFQSIPGASVSVDAIVVAGNKFFVRTRQTTGGLPVQFEIWVSDGTTTTMLHSMVQVPSSFDMLAYNGLLAFVSADATNGSEVWVSDGTAAGTKRLVDANPGPASSNPVLNKVIGGKLVFGTQAPKGTWASDGTPGGTTKVIADFNAMEAAEFNGQVYFTGVHQSLTGYVLARTNADFSGLQLLTPGSDLSLHKLTIVGDKLLYSHPSTGTDEDIEPFMADGTNNFVRLKDVNPGSSSSYPRSFASLGSLVVFIADDGVHGFELWKTDGTEGGTTFLKDISSGTVTPDIEDVYQYNDKLYFLARRSVASTRSLWVTDGTAGGTTLLDEPFYYPIFMYGANNYLITKELEIYKRDVETGEKSQMIDLFPPYNSLSYSSVRTSLTLGTAVYFFMRAATSGGDTKGMELWKADPATDEFNILKDINPGTASSDVTGGPFGVVLGDKMIFSATSTNGVEPWVTDGTEAGTILLKDIHPTGSSNPKGFTVFNGKVYFIAGNLSEGTEVWVTDGTPAGTMLVKDLVAGAQGGASSSATQMAIFNERLFFSTSPAAGVAALWSTDGVDFSSVPLPEGWTEAQNFVSSGNKLYFTAKHSTEGTELLSTDGTTAGTRILITMAGSSPPPTGIVPYNGGLFFVNDKKIWRTLGTTGSTRVIGTGAPTSPLYITKDHLVFTLMDPEYGEEFFRIGLPGLESQTITFSLPDRKIGEAPFQLNAVTTSELPITYEVIAGTVGKIAISGNTVTMIEPGKATIMASQSGNQYFLAAPNVSRTFCISPVKPVVTSSQTGGGVVLTSSAKENRWTLDGLPLSFTGQALTGAEDGVYRASAIVDGCQSEFSVEVAVITGVEDNSGSIELFPNPVSDRLFIKREATTAATIQLIDATGRLHASQVMHGETSIDVSGFGAGLYFVLINDGTQTHQRKFIKQ